MTQSVAPAQASANSQGPFVDTNFDTRLRAALANAVFSGVNQLAAKYPAQRVGTSLGFIGPSYIGFALSRNADASEPVYRFYLLGLSGDPASPGARFMRTNEAGRPIADFDVNDEEFAAILQEALARTVGQVLSREALARVQPVGKLPN